MSKVFGYKAMNLDMTCRGFQFEVGKTYKIENDKPLELCTDSGFHFCKRFVDVFAYYNWYKCRVFKVVTSSTVVTDGSKSITRELTIVGEVDRDYFRLLTLYFLSVSAKNYYNIMLEDDEDLIFNKFKDSVDVEVRAAVVNKLSNEDLIFNTFKDDKDWKVRIAVVQKLSDEKLIYDTFKDDEDSDVRKAVIKKLAVDTLSNEGMLKYFAEDDDYFTRGLARQELLWGRLLLL